MVLDGAHLAQVVTIQWGGGTALRCQGGSMLQPGGRCLLLLHCMRLCQPLNNCHCLFARCKAQKVLQQCTDRSVSATSQDNGSEITPTYGLGFVSWYACAGCGMDFVTFTKGISSAIAILPCFDDSMVMAQVCHVQALERGDDTGA